jgi:hypothetical protein
MKTSKHSTLAFICRHSIALLIGLPQLTSPKLAFYIVRNPSSIDQFVVDCIFGPAMQTPHEITFCVLRNEIPRNVTCEKKSI